MKMFQKRDELGTSDMSTKLNTTHQNQVSEVGLSAQLFKVETKLKIQFLGATLLWRQGVGRNYFHCRWRRKTRPLGYRSSQAEGSQDLERVQSLNFKPGGFDTFRQLSWFRFSGCKMVENLSWHRAFAKGVILSFDTFSYILYIYPASCSWYAGLKKKLQHLMWSLPDNLQSWFITSESFIRINCVIIEGIS